MNQTRFWLTSCSLLLLSGRCAAQEPVVVPDAKGNSGFTYQIKVEGGIPPYRFELAHATALPEGLALDNNSGLISGIPAKAQKEAYIFAVVITDDSDPKETVKQTFALKVRPAPLHVVGTMAAVSDPPEPPAPPDWSAQSAGPPAPQSKQQDQATTIDDTNKEWEARAIAGYHQAGASSAKFTQNFFFDFFISRALSSTSLWGACDDSDNCTGGRWSLWGDVRIASTPQQFTSGVGTFVSSFATNVSNLPVNQLAQSADFQSGLEYRLHTFVRKPGGQTLGYRTVGLVSYFGAQGAFEPPSLQGHLFQVPVNTPQYASFARLYPAAANSKFVAFVPPDRERFDRNYGFGVRVATYDKDQPLAAPGTYTFTVGQDESITGGIFRSVVGRFDVFYPLPLSGDAGKYKFLYLFGTANLRFSKAANIPTFALQDAPDSVHPYDSNVALITVRTTRDTYRIGAGIDLVNLIQTIKAPSTPASTAAKLAQKKAAN